MDLKHFRQHKNIFCGSRKSIWGQKRPLSVSYELNQVTSGLYRPGNSLNRPFFRSMPWEMWPEVDLKHFRQHKNIFWGSRKSIWGPKWPISVSYELNQATSGLFRLGNSLNGPFLWYMPWEMWPEADLKHFKRQKNIFRASKKSIWGPKRPIFQSIR